MKLHFLGKKKQKSQNFRSSINKGGRSNISVGISGKRYALNCFIHTFYCRDVKLIYSLPTAKKRRASSTASSAGSGENVTYRQSKIALRKQQVSICNDYNQTKKYVYQSKNLFLNY